MKYAIGAASLAFCLSQFATTASLAQTVVRMSGSWIHQTTSKKITVTPEDASYASLYDGRYGDGSVERNSLYGNNNVKITFKVGSDPSHERRINCYVFVRYTQRQIMNWDLIQGDPFYCLQGRFERED